MKNTKKIYIILFLILYVFVALVSGIHGFAFFGLANTPLLAIMLAIAFEIGQAAVLFSILTDGSQRKKFMPWVLMGILTLVQIMGNVYNSYKYLITYAEENLRFFKEPIFIWTQLPDAQANVILAYVQGAILPIVALLLTSMVAGFLNKKDDEEIEYIEEYEDEPGEVGEVEEETKDYRKDPIDIDDNEEDKVNDEYIENLPEEIEETLDEEPEKVEEIQEEAPVEEVVEKLPYESPTVEEIELEEPKEISLEPEQVEEPKSHFINL